MMMMMMVMTVTMVMAMLMIVIVDGLLTVWGVRWHNFRGFRVL